MRWALVGSRAGGSGSITAAPAHPQHRLCQGHGAGLCRLQVWRAQSGMTTQLPFQGGVEPHVLGVGAVWLSRASTGCSGRSSFYTLPHCSATRNF